MGRQYSVKDVQPFHRRDADEGFQNVSDNRYAPIEIPDAAKQWQDTGEVSMLVYSRTKWQFCQ
jgi:hypothetical protein